MRKSVFVSCLTGKRAGVGGEVFSLGSGDLRRLSSLMTKVTAPSLSQMATHPTAPPCSCVSCSRGATVLAALKDSRDALTLKQARDAAMEARKITEEKGTAPKSAYALS
jgi:hypothetical protein